MFHLKPKYEKNSVVWLKGMINMFDIAARNYEAIGNDDMFIKCLDKMKHYQTTLKNITNTNLIYHV